MYRGEREGQSPRHQVTTGVRSTLRHPSVASPILSCGVSDLPQHQTSGLESSGGQGPAQGERGDDDAGRRGELRVHPDSTKPIPVAAERSNREGGLCAIFGRAAVRARRNGEPRLGCATHLISTMTATPRCDTRRPTRGGSRLGRNHPAPTLNQKRTAATAMYKISKSRAPTLLYFLGLALLAANCRCSHRQQCQQVRRRGTMSPGRRRKGWGNYLFGWDTYTSAFFCRRVCIR